MINDGGPAFPVSTRMGADAPYGHQDSPSTWQFPGMTIRDYFAAKAMQALVGTCGGPALGGLDGMEPHTANAAYKMADAMLKAREEKP